MRFRLKRRGAEPSLKPKLDPNEAAWVSKNRRPFDTFSVGSLVPAVFERYARLLHPASSYANLPVRWAEVAGWSGRTIHPLAQWELLARPLPGHEVGRCPFILPPREGGLPPGHLRKLCGLLTGQTADPERCFIALWDGYGSPEVVLTAPESVRGSGSAPRSAPESAPGSSPGPASGQASDGNDQTSKSNVPPLWAGAAELRLEYRAFLVAEGSLATVAEMTGKHGAFGSRLPPTLFWPADHTWFVASDPDLNSTYVGGSAALIESILTDPELESWPATPDDDVTIGSDEINL